MATRILTPLGGLRRYENGFHLPPPGEVSSDFGQATYNFRNVLLHDRQEHSFEREISDHIAEQVAKAGCYSNGLFVPMEFFAKRDLSAGTGAGAGLVQTEVLPTIADALRPYSAAVALGCTVLPDLKSNISWPQWGSASSPQNLGEMSALTPSTQTSAAMNLTAHRISVQTIFSKQLATQASMALEELVKVECLKSIGSLIDAGVLAGSGTPPAPLGLLHQPVGSPPTIRQVQSVTFGGAASWNKICSFPQAVAAQNVVDDGTAGWAVSPNTKFKLDTAPKAGAGTYPVFICEEGKIDGKPVAVSNNLSGTAGGDRCIYAIWSNVVIGLWAIAVTRDVITAAVTGNIKLTIDAFFDTNVLKAPSVVTSSDSAAQ